MAHFEKMIITASFIDYSFLKNEFTIKIGHVSYMSAYVVFFFTDLSLVLITFAKPEVV